MAEKNISDQQDTEKLYYKTTTMCPKCERLIPGEVQAQNGGIYITRTCPDHGFYKGLVCSDQDWYENLPRFDVKPIKPSYSRNPTVRGCPEDCGLCPAHRQIAGTAAIEISNKCNSACPVCLADNKGTFELSTGEVKSMVENLLRTQDNLDVITLSGGEPTIHPNIFEIISMLEQTDIGRIVVNTNGKRIAEDDQFLDQLSAHKRAYVCLHYDGTMASDIRGTDFSVQEKALERLCRRDINTVPLVLAVQDINDRELGDIAIGLLTRSKSVKTVILSLMAYTGRGGSMFPSDPGRRLTIPGALDCIEEGTGGRMKKQDFMPLPMPNPLCAAIGYFLVQQDQITPLIPIAGVEQVADFLSNAHFGEPDEAFETFFRDVVDNIYADPDKYENSSRALSVLKDLLSRMFPPGGGIDDDERRRIAEESIKSVYLMQFMDSWTFDSVRMSKCSCQHLLPDGLIIPSCGYYSYHRRFDKRFEV